MTSHNWCEESKTHDKAMIRNQLVKNMGIKKVQNNVYDNCTLASHRTINNFSK